MNVCGRWEEGPGVSHLYWYYAFSPGGQPFVSAMELHSEHCPPDAVVRETNKK